MNKERTKQQEQLIIQMNKALVENLLLQVPEYSDCDVQTLLDMSKAS